MQVVHLLAQEALALGQLVAVGLGVEVDVGLQPDQLFAQARQLVDRPRPARPRSAPARRPAPRRWPGSGRSLLQHAELGVDLGQPAAAALAGGAGLALGALREPLVGLVLVRPVGGRLARAARARSTAASAAATRSRALPSAAFELGGLRAQRLQLAQHRLARGAGALRVGVEQAQPRQRALALGAQRGDRFAQRAGRRGDLAPARLRPRRCARARRPGCAPAPRAARRGRRGRRRPAPARAAGRAPRRARRRQAVDARRRRSRPRRRAARSPPPGPGAGCARRAARPRPSPASLVASSRSAAGRVQLGLGGRRRRARSSRAARATAECARAASRPARAGPGSSAPCGSGRR